MLWSLLRPQRGAQTPLRSPLASAHALCDLTGGDHFLFQAFREIAEQRVHGAFRYSPVPDWLISPRPEPGHPADRGVVLMGAHPWSAATSGPTQSGLVYGEFTPITRDVGSPCVPQGSNTPARTFGGWSPEERPLIGPYRRLLCCCVSQESMRVPVVRSHCVSTGGIR